ncbi:hypothetical protein H6P81_015869 [Aristolochia fimbriata]|uniref:Uncharacterized protein n=1 Tax=Aristolochia fimbriata TaxID=158543 RepID=A0AAV7E705_ARIFI|nr:hypothetical protein H6P81_015869 [Aristolochia fimbriata]
MAKREERPSIRSEERVEEDDGSGGIGRLDDVLEMGAHEVEHDELDEGQQLEMSSLVTASDEHGVESAVGARAGNECGWWVPWSAHEDMGT